jgi:solute carrier family 6 amino acid transporter-like protein 5/7/9/14
VFLALSWFIVFITQVNGVKTFGKISYLTSIGPYIFLFVLLIRVLTLDGAWSGIKLFFTPDLGKLLEAKVWYEAALQCFYSLNIYFSCVVMYSSFNKFNHDIIRDSNVISIVDTFTSLLAGVITFAVVGHICLTNGYDIHDIKALKNIAAGPRKFIELLKFSLGGIRA